MSPWGPTGVARTPGRAGAMALLIAAMAMLSLAAGCATDASSPSGSSGFRLPSDRRASGGGIEYPSRPPRYEWWDVLKLFPKGRTYEPSSPNFRNELRTPH